MLDTKVELFNVDNGIADSNNEGNTINSFGISISSGISLKI